MTAGCQNFIWNIDCSSYCYLRDVSSLRHFYSCRPKLINNSSSIAHIQNLWRRLLFLAFMVFCSLSLYNGALLKHISSPLSRFSSLMQKSRTFCTRIRIMSRQNWMIRFLKNIVRQSSTQTGLSNSIYNLDAKYVYRNRETTVCKNGSFRFVKIFGGNYSISIFASKLYIHLNRRLCTCMPLICIYSRFIQWLKNIKSFHRFNWLRAFIDVDFYSLENYGSSFHRSSVVT